MKYLYIFLFFSAGVLSFTKTLDAIGASSVLNKPANNSFQKKFYSKYNNYAFPIVNPAKKKECSKYRLSNGYADDHYALASSGTSGCSGQ